MARKGKKALKTNLIYMIPMLLFAALINPAFNHEGITVIMISHDMDAAHKYATHILQIGKDVFFGTKAEYLKSREENGI